MRSDGVKICNACSLPAEFTPAPVIAAAANRPGTPTTNERNRSKPPTKSYIGQLIGAVVLIGLGAAISGASWPTTDLYDNHSGSPAGVAFGLIVSAAGWCGFLIFAIAQGVLMGTSAANEKAAGIR